MALRRDASFPFVDVDLARRLEGAEGRANAACVETRARLSPALGATWLEVAGGYAMFDGPESPLTQTFGLGLFDAVTGADLAGVEAFFAERGAPTFHEVSPLAQTTLIELLNERRYRPIEFTSVMFRPLGVPDSIPSPAGLRVRVAGEPECDAWTSTAAAGWGEVAVVRTFMQSIGRVNMATEGATCFLAEDEGRPIATGVLRVSGGVALLAGGSTIPSDRGRGAQLALLAARLRHAAESGCDLAMMCAAPGSASQRNAERHGFRIAYTRIKWELAR